MDNEYMFIEVAGVIGVGKTHLTKEISKKYGYKAYYEPFINGDILKDFYNDMRANSFFFELYLLNLRGIQHKEVCMSKEKSIVDRSIYEDKIFCNILRDMDNIKEDEYNCYDKLSTIVMKEMLPKPDLIIYLKASPETCVKRIRNRNRACEDGLGIEYIRRLFEEYEKYMKELAKEIKVIEIDWEEFKDVEYVMSIINNQK